MNTGAFDISKSAYYQYWLLEQEEISKNRWYISERLGTDCGKDYATWDWIMRYRSKWVKEMRDTGKWVT